MTDLAALPSASARARHGLGRPAVLAGALVAAAFAGIALGQLHAADASGFEANLVLLLRFMALCKAAGVLGAAALVAWRLGRPLGSAAFAFYAAALVLMAAAPGMIWFLGLIAPGALLFHAGLLAFLVLAARDDGVASALRPRRG